MIASLLLLATSVQAGQLGKVGQGAGGVKPNPKIVRGGIKVEIPPPVLFVLPLNVTGPARDDSPLGRSDQLRKGFYAGLSFAAEQVPAGRGEAKVLNPGLVENALKNGDIALKPKDGPAPPKANGGTKLDPLWNMNRVAEIAAPLGADYIVLPYVSEFTSKLDGETHATKAVGSFTMWSVKTAKVVFADAPLGGTYSRPKVQGAFTPYEIGRTLGEKEFRPTFTSFWGKKNWKGKS